MRFSQIPRTTNPDQYTYTEFGSKNHSGGIADHSEGKTVSIVATGTPNCHVRIMDFYLSKVPPKCGERGRQILPYSPLPFTPTGMRPWFFTDPYPQKKIQGLMKKCVRKLKLREILLTIASEQQGPQFFSTQVFQRTSYKRGRGTSHWMLYVPTSG